MPKKGAPRLEGKARWVLVSPDGESKPIPPKSPQWDPATYLGIPYAVELAKRASEALPGVFTARGTYPDGRIETHAYAAGQQIGDIVRLKAPGKEG